MVLKSRAALLALMLLAGAAGAQDWRPVTDPDVVRELFSDTVLTTELKKGVTATARFSSDGTGELKAWGDTFPRQWRVEDDGRACILISGAFECFRIDRNTGEENEFRGTNVATGESVIFTVEGREIRSVVGPKKNAGGAGEPSAEELAAKLANPTTPVMTIGNNLDFITFKGDLPDAGGQSAFRYVFQTSFPFKLSNGGSIFFRPAIPVLFNDPVPNGEGGFDSKGTDFGDIGFDFSYGATTEGGLLWGGGLVGTFPTATDDALGKDRWALGPEILLGVIRKWGVIGGILAHQWDYAGSGDASIDLTSLSYFYAFSLGGGWQIAAGPTISYDHARGGSDAWTVPVGVGLARTSVLAGRPWKFQLQYWNYVRGADAFAPQHQIRLSINPVIEAPWNRGK